jgi:branched-chain amino acid transport system permease protein
MASMRPPGSAPRSPRFLFPCLLLLLPLFAFPLIAPQLGLDYYIGFVRRLLIFGLIATSLNFILGYGGLVALGHAGFVGVGAYCAAALADAGVASLWLSWGAAMLSSASMAAAIGAISLRTRGVYFIMITLAFAQMLYYVAVSLSAYGGEDGFSLPGRPVLWSGGAPLDESSLYWLVLCFATLAFLAFAHLGRSRFGHALAGMRDNEQRMHALGYPVFRLRLTAFVLAGAVAGLGGAMLAASNNFVSPSMMHWTQSATLLVMVVLGGMGTRWGGVVGAVIWLSLEELLKPLTDYWHLPLGLLLLGIALYMPKGLASLAARRERR